MWLNILKRILQINILKLINVYSKMLLKLLKRTLEKYIPIHVVY
jgi:hypothetical protein